MKVMAISDLQIPFQHKDALDFCKAVNKKEKPDRIIQMGDLIDVHNPSDHDSDPDGYSPGHELNASQKEMVKWVKAFPDLDILMGNHDMRYYRAAFKARIPSAVMKSMGDILKTPKSWKYHTEIELDGIRYIHGDGMSSGISAMASLNLTKLYLQPIVHGHFHVNAGIFYVANKKHLLYSFNTGCLIDHKAYAFMYADRNANKPILGIGIIENGVPKFIPMMLDRAGNWTGKL